MASDIGENILNFYAPPRVTDACPNEVVQVLMKKKSLLYDPFGPLNAHHGLKRELETLDHVKDDLLQVGVVPTVSIGHRNQDG